MLINIEEDMIPFSKQDSECAQWKIVNKKLAWSENADWSVETTALLQNFTRLSVWNPRAELHVQQGHE